LSHITHDVAATASYGWVLGLTTAFFLATFVGWVFTMYRASAKPLLDAAARLPLEEGR
jgi:cbb3-type cytochrome oxidase subunit 3